MKQKRGRWGAGILLAALAAACIFVYGPQVIDRLGIGNHIEFRNWKAGPVEFTDASDGDQGPFSLLLNETRVGLNMHKELTVTLAKDIFVDTFTEMDGTPIGVAKTDLPNEQVWATIARGRPWTTSLKLIDSVYKKPVFPMYNFHDTPRDFPVLQEDDKRLTYAKYKEAVIKASKNITYPDGRSYYEPHREGQARQEFFKKLFDDFVDNEYGTYDRSYGTFTRLTGEAHFLPTKRIWTGDKYDSGKFVKKVSIIVYRGNPIADVELTWENTREGAPYIQ